FGIKETEVGFTGEELLRRELTTRLLFDMMFSPSSKLYQSLYDEKLITDSFGSEYNASEKYAFSVMGGDTRDPEALIQRVREEVESWKKTGIPVALFERTRRKKIGGFYRMLNSVEAIAGEFTKHRFRGTNVFDVLELYEQITID